MNLSFFLARKILGSKEKNTRKVSRPAIKIAILGVAIGICVMLISVSIVFGFKDTIRNKVVGFGSHIEVANTETLSSSMAYPIQMDSFMLKKLSAIPGVTHAQRYAYVQGILKTNEDFLGVNFKGVGPEWDSTFIHQNMVEGSIPRWGTQQLRNPEKQELSNPENLPTANNQIVISQSMADKLKLKVGQKVFAYFINKQGVRMRRFLVAGIYETNLTQYDDIIAFCDLHTAVALNGWEDDEATGAELSIADFNQLAAVSAAVKNTVAHGLDAYGNTYDSRNIKELAPQIFSWLGLLDMNVWVILGLMMLVSSVTMISGLLIIILERTQMIGILKALGSRNSVVRRTFVCFGGFIILRGMLIGNVLAFLLMFLQDRFGFAKLDASVYYVSNVPIEWCWLWFIAINVGTLLLSMLIMILPTMLVAHIKPVKAIRFE